MQNVNTNGATLCTLVHWDLEHQDPPLPIKN